jgi:alginate O-acetyltransferase complex protein AlgI
MIFSSVEFLFGFLPLTVVVFFGLAHFGQRQLAKVFITVASLVFYGWWNVAYLWLLLASIGFNYVIGHYLYKMAAIAGELEIVPPSTEAAPQGATPKRQWLLWFGLMVNLVALGYCKYTNFFITTANSLLQANLPVQAIVLPLAISFFTFTQIAYIVDAYKLKTKPYSFLNYALFITFFPHLIAGPIIHHHELIPQFESKSIYRLNLRHLAIGLTFFGLGLAKKVIFADYAAGYANTIFYQADHQAVIPLVDAWIGAIAYTVQLYFDFSGYSDMAIGAAKIFGIDFPANFNSPYKAISIVDFWRRWHITLSNFLRDYLYIPLGGSRHGVWRRHLNLIITMLLGGLWHGAGWPFVIWGGMHGVFLVMNHQWNAWQKQLGYNFGDRFPWSKVVAAGVTFVAVVVAWVFFRAETLPGAFRIINGILGRSGLGSVNWHGGQLLLLLAVLAGLLGIARFAPNTQELIEQQQWRPLNQRFQSLQQRLAIVTIIQKVLPQSPSYLFGMVLGILFFISSKIFLSASSNEFLYFNF